MESWFTVCRWIKGTGSSHLGGAVSTEEQAVAINILGAGESYVYIHTQT